MKKITYPLFLRHPRLSSVSNDAKVVCCPVGVLVCVGAGKMYLQLAIAATVTAMDRLTPLQRWSAGWLQAR